MLKDLKYDIYIYVYFELSKNYIMAFIILLYLFSTVVKKSSKVHII